MLIGASRTFFDVQLPVWERLSGRRADPALLRRHLARVTCLEDLAGDPAFTGRLLIGIAPDIYFSGFEYQKNGDRYTRKESPSQRIGQLLSMHLIEPWLAFYDPDFALFTVLRRQPWPDREGLSGHSVRKLSITEADRNNYMWSKLETDRAYQALAQSIWAENFDQSAPTAQEAAENQRTLDEQIRRTSAAVARLRARHVPVIFVRDPSAGGYLTYEDQAYPRKSTWDVLLERTGAPGIYFQDYPELRNYVLPDWSHMTRASAERYTVDLYRIMQHDFPLPDGTHW